MELNYVKLIETVAVIGLYLVLRLFVFKVIDKTRKDRFILEARGVIIKKVLHGILLSISLIFIMLIWGVNQADLAIFMGSILTVVGVAFFAQWSLLSNITSSLILFFNHPVRLNDHIQILEGKDYLIEGKVTNIGLFFITIETPDSEEITLPNNIFIQKSIRKKPGEAAEKA